MQDRSLLSPTHRPNAQHHHICEKRPVQKTYRRAPQKRPITRERHTHTCESLPPNTNTQHHHLCENQTSLPPTYTQKRTHTQMHTWESPPPNTNISAPHIQTECPTRGSGENFLRSIAPDQLMCAALILHNQLHSHLAP